MLYRLEMAKRLADTIQKFSKTEEQSPEFTRVAALGVMAASLPATAMKGIGTGVMMAGFGCYLLHRAREAELRLQKHPKPTLSSPQPSFSPRIKPI